ncbi:MAG: PAS domain S-box protein [Desulfuromonadales bacterium]
MNSENRKHIESDDFRTLIASSVDGVTLVDAVSGYILDVNDSYCRMLGYTRDELLNMHMSDVDVFDSAEAVIKRSEEIILRRSLRFETKQ